MSPVADIYQAQVRLLVQVLPYVAQREEFALKGGTAINFFFRDAPRLSVDIDLHYLPACDRDPALTNIDAALRDIARQTSRAMPDIRVDIRGSTALMQRQQAQIKLEVNPVIRGELLPQVHRSLCPNIAKQFAADIDLRCLDLAELFAGKLCAALDRQHPRDIFDVKYLLESEGGLTRDIVDAFLIYLISHSKPIAHVLSPRLQPLEQAYRTQFRGMANEEIPLETLKQLQRDLPALIWASLTDDDKTFLLGFKRQDPDWSLLRHVHAAQLPAVRWKMQNLADWREKKPKDYEKGLAKLERTLLNGPWEES